MNRCLKCYRELGQNETDYHEKCAKKFFGIKTAPALPYSMAEIAELAKKILERSASIPGVQPKLSIDIDKQKGGSRLTLVGLWGEYILKPPSTSYEALPENEDLTMSLAGLVKLKTADHCLIRMASGELAYITKRFDRDRKSKMHIEDMAQLTGTLTEHKYKKSSEVIAKTIKQYSSYPGYDLITFFETLLFSYITGNSDMHLKNFSLLRQKNGEIIFSPAYDLLSTKLALSSDEEDLALPMNGKKSSLKREDFDKFAEYSGINAKTLTGIYDKFSKAFAGMRDLIDISFLPEELKNKYIDLLEERMTRIGLL